MVGVRKWVPWRGGAQQARNGALAAILIGWLQVGAAMGRKPATRHRLRSSRLLEATECYWCFVRRSIRRSYKRSSFCSKASKRRMMLGWSILATSISSMPTRLRIS